jgi:hypothetical protein
VQYSLRLTRVDDSTIVWTDSREVVKQQITGAVVTSERKRGDRGVKILALFLLAGASAGARLRGAELRHGRRGRTGRAIRRPSSRRTRAPMDDPSPNAPLGVEKMLSAALLEHNWQDAESYAVRASTLVNIFVAGEPGERDALSLFGQEKDKPFKGGASRESHGRLLPWLAAIPEGRLRGRAVGVPLRDEQGPGLLPAAGAARSRDRNPPTTCSGTSTRMITRS